MVLFSLKKKKNNVWVTYACKPVKHNPNFKACSKNSGFVSKVLLRKPLFKGDFTGDIPIGTSLGEIWSASMEFWSNGRSRLFRKGWEIIVIKYKELVQKKGTHFLSSSSPLLLPVRILPRFWTMEIFFVALSSLRSLRCFGLYSFAMTTKQVINLKMTAKFLSSCCWVGRFASGKIR